MFRKEPWTSVDKCPYFDDEEAAKSFSEFINAETSARAQFYYDWELQRYYVKISKNYV